MQLRFLALLWLALLSFSVSAQRYMDMIEAGTYTVAQIQEEAKAYFDIVGRGRGTGYKQFKRWEYVALMEMDETGVKISNVVLSGKARDYRRAEKLKRTESSLSADDWKQLGPTYRNATSSWNPGVGRVNSIGIDVGNPNHIIVGSPTGGVWKSLDGGGTWAALTDDFSTTDVFSLEISPYNNQHYLWGSASGKIYRSTDGGATWAATGNVTGNGRVSRIQYHPTNPNIVYAASESNGLFRSTNAGSTWTAVSGASGVPGYDIEFKPGDPNTIYFSGILVYRSTNGGTSFSQITGFGTESNNYKMMGVSAANPNFVYLLESDGGRFGAFYKSTNSGASYTKLIDGADINFFGYSETGDDDRGQAPRDMDVAVNPSNANEVHIAGVHTWKSTNGGTSFNLSSYWTPGNAASLGVGYNHADVAILKFLDDVLYVGSDGGLHISVDGAASFIDLSSGLGIREFYKIGVSKSNPNVVSGGAQDNGTSLMRGPNREWVDWLGADGMETFVSWNNSSIIFGTSQNGSMYRSTNQGNSQNGIAKPPGVDDGAWVTPFEQDPQVANTIYVAFEDVWKSTNSGGDWVKISSFANGNMSQMKLAPSDNKRIYVSRGSSLFTTANGGTNWTTTAVGWGSSTINYISVHPTDPQRVLIVTSSSVYQSTNAGTSWTTISAGLPSGSKYCAAWENTGKNGIYIGGFGYVSYTNDALSGQWVGFMNGLPNTRVYELEINYVSNTIFAGTYGRGLWESPLYQAQAPTSAFSADKQLGCREMTVAFTDHSVNGPTAWEWTFEGGTPATSNLQNPVVTFSAIGNHTVQLKTSNNVGESTVVETDYITIIGPPVPFVVDVERCGPGEVALGATGSPANSFIWYASATDPVPLFTGDELIINIAQTSTYYVSAGTEFIQSQHVGPAANDIGNGDNHAGGYFLILDTDKPFLLKSALVYASGAGDRVFQLLDENSNVLLEKTIFVNDGENRVTLDMNVPQGIGFQIGCPNPANLFRNNSGVSYPYVLPGLMQIRSSTAGANYYYYLYDLEVESAELCESERVPVMAVVIPDLPAPAITASSTTPLCAGESLLLSANNPCADCTVQWSTGESGPTISVSTAGNYTATLRNGCGDGPTSDTIEVTTETIPLTPEISVSGATSLCPGESLTLSAENLCAGCSLTWSNGADSPSITISTPGTYTAIFNNICGSGPVSAPVVVELKNLPDAAIIDASGATSLCIGEYVVLTAEHSCPDCSVLWSTDESGPNITVTTAGLYTAVLHNTCGDSPESNAITVVTETVPDAPAISASGNTTLCPGESLSLSVDNVCPDCSVQWSNGESGPNITVSSDGIYTATLRNKCGDSQISNVIEIKTATLPELPIVSASGTTSLCPGASVVFMVDNVCPDCTINWVTGESGQSITVSEAGVYTASLHNLCGDGPVSSPIEVNEADVPALPVISASGATALCPGETVILSVDNVCLDCSVNWSNGEMGQSVTVSSGGIYTAILHNNCGDSPASNAIEVLVGSIPEAPLIAVSGATALCPGETVTLSVENLCPDCTVNWSNGSSSTVIIVSEGGTYMATVSNTCGNSPVSNVIQVSTHPVFVPTVQIDNFCHLSAPAGSDYQWFLNGEAISGATGPLWTALVNGQYTVSMIDNSGCAGVSTAVFAQACVSSGTDNPDGFMSVRVYPNPAQDKLFLDLQTLRATELHFDLFTSDGRFVGQLFQGAIPAGRQIVDIALPDLPAGMYRYRLATEMGSLNGSLVVQR